MVTKSLDMIPQVLLVLMMAPQIFLASQSRSYVALFLKPIKKATAVPINAMGTQGSPICFTSKTAYSTVGMVEMIRNRNIARLVHRMASNNPNDFPTCIGGQDSAQIAITKISRCLRVLLLTFRSQKIWEIRVRQELVKHKKTAPDNPGRQSNPATRQTDFCLVFLDQPKL